MEFQTFGKSEFAVKLIQAFGEKGCMSYQRKVGRLFSYFNRSLNSLRSVHCSLREPLIFSIYNQYQEKVRLWDNNYIRYLVITLMKIRLGYEKELITTENKQNEISGNLNDLDIYFSGYGL